MLSSLPKKSSESVNTNAQPRLCYHRSAMFYLEQRASQRSCDLFITSEVRACDSVRLKERNPLGINVYDFIIRLRPLLSSLTSLVYPVTLIDSVCVEHKHLEYNTVKIKGHKTDRKSHLLLFHTSVITPSEEEDAKAFGSENSNFTAQQMLHAFLI